MDTHSQVYDDDDDNIRKRSSLEIRARTQVHLIGDADQHRLSDGRVSMKDKPSLVGDYLIYVSTHEEIREPRTSWAAVYSTRLSTGSTRRLTPYGVADFSPATSPSGEWTAVASLGEKGWGGEIDELNTDIYVFRTRDGSGRVKVAEHGGWPSWADESTVYFHRRGDDGWWSIYKAVFSGDSVATHRVTPPGVHAFTPAASVANKSFIAVATRRPNSDFRHIELYDLEREEFIQVTRYVSPSSHHYNPFISPDSTKIGYHKCRGSKIQRGNKRLLLENIRSPIPEISLFRVFGSFPSFSSSGHHIAYVDLFSRNSNPGVYVMKKDGSGLRRIVEGMAFSTAWDPKREGVMYTSVGPTFAAETTKVDIISVDINSKNNSGHKRLTTGGENNAFPSPSPDGKWVVFRSGRSGYKNLYIMDAVDGERGGLHRLTEGPWTDTMCNWSPRGEWIAFASDRENPGSGSFEIFMIHPDGTGLKKLVHSGTGGRTNHPWFSPDGETVVFTSDYAAVSAEPISNPHHYQPYGDIFVIGSDGNGIKRMTHNSFENGTPTWGPSFIKPKDVTGPSDGSECDFDDCHWLSDFPDYGFMGMSSDKVQCGG